MIRYLKLANDKNRDAEITFRSLNPKPKITLVMETGDKVINKRIIKNTSKSNIKALIAKYHEKPNKVVNIDEKLATILADNLINSDPEIDLELSGKSSTTSPEFMLIKMTNLFLR